MYKNNHKNERGQSIVLIAIAMIALIAFVSLAIDGGMAYTQRRIAQNAADSAAISATFEIRMQNRSTDSNARSQPAVLAEIKEAVVAHGVVYDEEHVAAYYTDALGAQLSTCKVGSCPTTVMNNAWGVRVNVSKPFSTFFAGVIGWHKMT
ncbi:MAG: Tad domain-containing protein, partial [Ardenticatenales bacterium]|nr:Tad domain-containing protein [Ardenticatenales bacterium]